MDPVIFIELAIDDVKPLAGFESETRLLTTTYQVRSRTVLGFCASDVAKGPDVSGIFKEVPPLASGGWHLELAIELADRLPVLGGSSESIVDVKVRDGSVRKLCLSNRISRFHFADETRSYHVLVPRTQPWHGAARISNKEGKLLPAAEEPLRTVASMRFDVAGQDAENAFESNISARIEDFFSGINAALKAVRDCRKGFTPVTRAIRRDGVGSIYVLMIGDGKEGIARLALNAARIGMFSESLDGDAADRFRALARGSIVLSDIQQILDEAKSSYEDGEYEFGFLQAVIAAEIATTRAVRAECEKRGVSKNKLDETRKEMTYSWALNIGLPLCFSPGQRPKQELVAAMNAARSKRNDLMHEARFGMTRKELRRLIEDTRTYIAALAT